MPGPKPALITIPTEPLAAFQGRRISSRSSHQVDTRIRPSPPSTKMRFETPSNGSKLRDLGSSTDGEQRSITIS